MISTAAIQIYQHGDFTCYRTFMNMVISFDTGVINHHAQFIWYTGVSDQYGDFTWYMGVDKQGDFTW